MANENSNVVVDRAQSHWSDLWKKEDYWAIWLGFALLIAAICIFINGAPASYKDKFPIIDRDVHIPQGFRTPVIGLCQF